VFSVMLDLAQRRGTAFLVVVTHDEDPRTADAAPFVSHRRPILIEGTS
jgi:hypothetical protein